MIKIYGIASLDIVIQEIIWYTINKVSMLCCSQANTLPIKCSFKGEGEEFIIKFSVVRSAWTFFVFFYHQTTSTAASMDRFDTKDSCYGSVDPLLTMEVPTFY